MNDFKGFITFNRFTSVVERGIITREQTCQRTAENKVNSVKREMVGSLWSRAIQRKLTTKFMTGNKQSCAILK